MRSVSLRVLSSLAAWSAVLAWLAVSVAAQQRVVVAVDGAPGGDGTAAAPLSFDAALDALRERAAAGDLPEGGIELVLRRGRYRFTQAAVLGKSVRGTASAPIRIRSERRHEAVFDGSVDLEAAAFRPVRDPATRTRLAAAAVDDIVVLDVADPVARQRLRSEIVLPLIIDGRVCLPARFPNQGEATLQADTVRGEVSPPAVPVGKEDYGVRAGNPPYVEPGKPQGWLGSRAEPRGAFASIDAGADQMAGTWPQWEAELARDNTRCVLRGYLEANWLFREQPLVAADAATQSIHLARALAYGWGWRNKGKPFHVFGLLCELDAPGEWWFDAESNQLFLRPPEGFRRESDVRLPVADGFLQLDGAEHVQIEGLVVQHVARGDVFRLGGRNNTLAACRVERSTALGVRIGGTDQAVLGCDFVDLNGHVALGGGRRGPGRLEAGRNRVENCHVHQQHFEHRSVNVSVRGVGNVLRNCLIHDSFGQAVTVAGNDHLLEANELFNIGYAEGDGGAIYSGGDLTGYGITYRHNFIHHLMHVPGKVERSGIHLDDLQAGATCVGNVFFKSAGKGIFMNGGAGHVLEGNVFLAGYRGAYNVGHGAQKGYERQRAIDSDPNHEYRNTKENYIGRAEKVLGVRGWREEPWRSRYPTMLQVLDDDGQFGRYWPIRCRIEDNSYFDNVKGDGAIWSRVVEEARAKSVIRGERVLTAEAFVDYDALDLRWREPAGQPEIPFARIGLRLDEFRASRPDPASYRRAVREFFRGVPSMPGTTERFDSTAAVLAAPQITR